jgi:monoamine oxidase
MAEEIVVIGSGLAGAFAAARLAEVGCSVRVLEGRRRVGGRAFARPLAGSAERLELGGAWIAKGHHRLQREAARLGFAWRPRTPVTARRWWHDGRLSDGPPAGQREAHERVLARVAEDASRRAAGEPGVTASFADYLRELDPPPATRELLSAWWCLSGNGSWERAPASDFLGACSHHDNTPDGIIGYWHASLAGGMDCLAAGLLESAGVLLELGVAVTALRHHAGGVEVQTADGRRLAAAAAILATGLNPLRRIAFDPPLPEPKRRAIAHGHEGIAVKIWAEVEGAAVGVLATGGGSGLEWLFAERESGRGTTFLVGFGLASPAFDPDDRAEVERAVARFFPEARLIAHDRHDWIADPFSLGTWVALPHDQPEAVAPATWRPEGRLAFASSDFAEDQQGWFEGAAASGEAAAEAVLAYSRRSSAL